MNCVTICRCCQRFLAPAGAGNKWCQLANYTYAAWKPRALVLRQLSCVITDFANHSQPAKCLLKNVVDLATVCSYGPQTIDIVINQWHNIRSNGTTLLIQLLSGLRSGRTEVLQKQILCKSCSAASETTWAHWSEIFLTLSYWNAGVARLVNVKKKMCNRMHSDTANTILLILFAIHKINL